jgi:hypothetical protein
MILIKVPVKVFLIFIFIAIPCYMFSDEGDVLSTFQYKVLKANHLLLEKYKKNKNISQKDIKTIIEPLLYESLTRKNIWGLTSDFKTVISPSIGMIKGQSVKNPYFTYAFNYWLQSKRFKNGGISMQQETCEGLVSFLSIPRYSKFYKDFHHEILFFLFQYFHSNEYYNKRSISFINRLITSAGKYNPIPLPRYLLLLSFIDRPLDHQVKLVLRRRADKCNFFDRKNLRPWYSLILLARAGEEKYLNKLVSIVKSTDNSMSGIKKATYMFPYLSMVPKTEIIELMRSFLKDEKIIDQGSDVVRRYKGLSRLAAEVLYSMLEGYEIFSPYAFNQKERIKCLNWFEKNKQYKFRQINYWKSDRIISRMRYLIFFVR